MENVNWIKAPPDWDPDAPNPFSPSGEYGNDWTAFTFISGSPSRLHYPGRCRSERGCFSCQVGLQSRELAPGIADFLRYESDQGRTVIISCPADVDASGLVERALATTPTGNTVRDDDPKWGVHSTTLERWHRIQQCGELRSMARLHKEGTAWPEIAFEQLGEPPEYREYIVLGGMESIGCENVVASHQKGYVFTDENAPYTPGIRLYFDLHSIIKDGLAVRDGLHLIKVRDHLRLEPYLVAAIGIRDLDPGGGVSKWTPGSFLEAANDFFRKTTPP
jgi:hypothetical protein